MNIIKQLTNRKYQLFTKKIKDVEVAVWEAEFKIAKSRQVREGIRQDRDRAIEHSLQLEPQIESEKDKEVKTVLEEQKEKIDQDVKRYESQMQMIDRQINGFTGNETEESVIGILEQLASYAELKMMYQDYRSKI